LVRQNVCIGKAGGWEFHVAKDVPVLRADHSAPQALLPGVRQVAETGVEFLRV